jgi:hypothetical protein
MLLVIGTESAVVRAAIFDRGVIDHRLLRRFDEDLAGATIVIDVVGYQHALMTVLGAALQHPHLVIFKDDLGVNAPIARGADRDGDVVEKIGAELVCHGVSMD